MKKHINFVLFNCLFVLLWAILFTVTIADIVLVMWLCGYVNYNTEQSKQTQLLLSHTFLVSPDTQELFHSTSFLG